MSQIPNNFGVSHAIPMNITSSASARAIANFAWQHMRAATIFRDHVHDLELAHAGSGLGDHFELIRSYASACLMSTASSLEALINEYFIAPNCKLRSTFHDFDREFWGKGGVERWGIFVKYQHALKLLNLPLMDEASDVYQDSDALINLRNSLVHHKPTWDPDQPNKASLTSYLWGKYDISPFVSANDDFVTMQSMSYGCCKWAIDTAFAFIHEFDSKAHIDDDKMIAFWRLET
jgi:hypothetical protein